MEKEYNHLEIEKKWQEKWEQDRIYKTINKIEDKENFYQLVEFSYPSGNLHTGHWYAFSVPDIYARYKRMQGYNVFYPMGFDSFGLPAENASIKQGANPRLWTYEQMDKMRKQLRSMGAMFDWDREIVSCAPEYYKWTQWMFNQFLKNDLVYRANTKVNWCPKDKTILANEQVVDGKCERCDGEIIQKDQDQWMLRITKYADRLIDDLDSLSWPHAIKESQKNWIGRSSGSELEFKLKITSNILMSSGRYAQPDDQNTRSNFSENDLKIKVFTTRADTLFGVTYVVLAPEHSLLENLLIDVENREEAENYIKETKKKLELQRQQEKEKTGVELKGIKAINPINNEEVPVWIADYVLASYGTGAVMAVPAHDQRDNEFAKKYDLPIKEVVLGKMDEYGVLVNSGEFDGLTSEEAKKKITEKAGGKLINTYRLRDWGISRQRYWGCPIPVVYDPEGKVHSIPDEHLPWMLPEDVDHTPDGTEPLARSKELFERTEKIFGKGWTPEVETMDTFVDSSWYFYRYLDNKNDKEFASKDSMDAWMPIDLYMGGAEHTTMHLLYSRFWTKALFDCGLVKDNEAYKVRLNRGLILGPDGNKMSKSKGNVINPDEIVERLGADTVRMYLAFMGPYGTTANFPWDPNGVVGVRRFLERVWKNKNKISKEKTATGLHKTIKKIREDIEEHKYNTCISQMMIVLNDWEKEKEISIEDYKTLIKLLAPFAPHITEELWFLLGEERSIHLEDFPVFDEDKTIEEELNIPVQVNGKVRGQITIKFNMEENEVSEIALKQENIKKFINTQEIKKVIYVKNRLLNIVI